MSIIDVTKLMDHIRKETQRPIGWVSLNRMATRVEKAAWDYSLAQHWPKETKRQPDLKPDLHKIQKPLQAVLELVHRRGNLLLLRQALREPGDTPDQVFAKYETMIDCLERISRKAEDTQPVKRASSGRPGKNTASDPFYVFIDALADVWETETKKPFKQRWTPSHEPLTPAVCFVVDVVKQIDPKRVRQLPTVTKKLVTDRSQKKGKYRKRKPPTRRKPKRRP